MIFTVVSVIFLAVPDLLKKLHKSPVPINPIWGVLVFAAVGILVLVLRRMERRMENTPNLELIEISKQLTITASTADSSIAQVMRIQIERATRDVDSRIFSIGNFRADGKISDIRIDDQALEEHEMRFCEGAWVIRKLWIEPISKGTTIQTKLTATLTDCHKNQVSETSTQTIQSPVELVKMIVKLPANKECKSARVALMYNNRPHKDLGEPEISEDKKTLSFQVKQPPMGAQYRITWAW